MAGDFEIAREAYTSFGKSGSLDDLNEALDILTDILLEDDSDAKVKNLYLTIKRSEIDKAKVVCKESNDPDKIKKAHKILESICQTGMEKKGSLSKLNKLKNELLMAEDHCKRRASERERDAFVDSFIQRYEKDEPED